MKIKFILTGIIGALFISCSNSAPNEKITSTDSLSQLPPPASTESAGTIQEAKDSQRTTLPSVPVSAPVATSQPSSPVAEGMNPPHGQPGHRCDISVGAPLNSAPTPPPASTMQMGTQSVSPSQITNSAPGMSAPGTTAPTVTAPGMNPPHGQPGHDCTIAVGAPLKK